MDDETTGSFEYPAEDPPLILVVLMATTGVALLGVGAGMALAFVVSLIVG